MSVCFPVNPCLNDGICTPIEGPENRLIETFHLQPGPGYTCNCQGFFTGRNCSTPTITTTATTTTTTTTTTTATTNCVANPCSGRLCDFVKDGVDWLCEEIFGGGGGAGGAGGGGG